jgi:hypothetical protein
VFFPFFFPVPFFQKFHVLKPLFQKKLQKASNAQKKKKKRGYNKYLCLLRKCMLGVGGRETGKDPFDIIADPYFGPIQRIFF